MHDHPTAGEVAGAWLFNVLAALMGSVHTMVAWFVGTGATPAQTVIALAQIAALVSATWLTVKRIRRGKDEP